MNTRNKILESLSKDLDIPKSAYDEAEQRYDALTDFIEKHPLLNQYDPHIFVQGSFALGTAIKPMGNDAAYDIDLGCKLRQKIDKTTHSQMQLKTIVKDVLSEYVQSNGFKRDVEEKRRCWTIEYSSTPSFHLDIVPCIPESEEKRREVALSMESYYGESYNDLRDENYQDYSIAITDNNDPSNYSTINNEWPQSNPEGYAKWFKRQSDQVHGRVARATLEARIDKVPRFAGEKTPLQKTVQILKKHRDEYYSEKNKNTDLKPISIIISTIAAKSYSGEATLEEALVKTVQGLSEFINSGPKYEVPNPVKPSENFADKWEEKPTLISHFRAWVNQLNQDLSYLAEEEVSMESISTVFKEGFGLEPDLAALGKECGIGSQQRPVPGVVNTPKASPWSRACD
ncbi:MAG: nucleotidyltransferase [Methyloprofundus sp.]|nr:nucleotidyltransferase [Methyloprofundus sp.]